MNSTTLYTIGFTRTSARDFFEKLRASNVRRIIDVRLNNTSQLAGFSKRDDLVYFLREIAGIEYIHLPQLAPTAEMLDEYKKLKGGWDTYERKFMELMEDRRIETSVPKDLVDQGCLLCSEYEPDHCHRRLVAEYLKRHWTQLRTDHLV